MSLVKFKAPGELPIDRIIAYLESDVESDADITEALSAKDREILTQIEFVDTQIKEFNRTPKKVVAMMMKKFINQATGRPISKDTCYRRIRQAQRVYGAVDKRTKDYWRNYLVDTLLKNIQRASVNNDVRGVNAAAAIMERVLQLGKDEQGLLPEDVLERIVVQHVLDPRIAGFDVIPDETINNLYRDMTGDVAKPYMDFAQDAEYEDLTDHDGE